jgi:NAD(P)-dependent dehydrogenase (short-subunit alcohol dehydrogenase family)
MSTKTILVTGSTDGIGLDAAKKFAAMGHTILLHGRNEGKLADVHAMVAAIPGAARIGSFTADLSRLNDIEALAAAVMEQHDSLDVLLNNAGVFRTANPRIPEGLDVRFMVNTIAPYLLTKRLLPLIAREGRIINLSSAAQARVDLRALEGVVRLSDNEAYAQSKLALTAWSRAMALELGDAGPVVVAVNPGSLLATKMVKQAYGVSGKDINIGSDVLVRAALSDEFASATGRYFDNDSGRFAPPHVDATRSATNEAIVHSIEAILSRAGIAV